MCAWRWYRVELLTLTPELFSSQAVADVMETGQCSLTRREENKEHGGFGCVESLVMQQILCADGVQYAGPLFLNKKMHEVHGM